MFHHQGICSDIFYQNRCVITILYYQSALSFLGIGRRMTCEVNVYKKNFILAELHKNHNRSIELLTNTANRTMQVLFISCVTMRGLGQKSTTVI